MLLLLSRADNVNTQHSGVRNKAAAATAAAAAVVSVQVCMLRAACASLYCC
jgi:uncharacterized protein (UPF0548 family)